MRQVVRRGRRWTGLPTSGRPSWSACWQNVRTDSVSCVERFEGISQKVLTQSLRSLERDGIVSRKVFDTPPSAVEYSLTPLGQSLAVPLSAIREWAEAHIEEILAARKRALPDVPRE